jgi:hypothetical protein
VVIKRRFVRRQRQRGAVLFIVAMTLAVLAALGGYALVASSNEIRTAGYARQNAQTHYMSEFGVLGAAQNINAETAGTYIDLMTSNLKKDTGCISLPAVPSGYARTALACRRMGSAELANVWAGQRALPASKPLGNVPLTGDFFIEATEAYQTQPAAGNSVDLLFVQFTITAVGITQPTGTDTAKPEQLYGNEGLEMARARITAGPIRR